METSEKRSETLWTEVHSLLKEASVSIHDVDCFAVCTGPGAFTGLRIGMAAAKGFSAATNKPITGVSSLEAAAAAGSPAPLVCSMVNAYKGEVYSQLFSFDDEGVPEAENDPLVSTFEEALERVGGVSDLVFAGEDAEAGAEVIRGFAEVRGRQKWDIRQSSHCIAEEIARLGCLRYLRGNVETAATLKACYVRPAEAEIKLSLGLLGSKIKRSMKTE